MSGDEITETAKATQEVAKTASKAIDVVEKFGGFVARVIGEPIDCAVGMLTDKLRFMRWERQVRMVDRCEEFMRARRLTGNLRPVAPKLALPIIENASLEENDELQDIWARLLTSALDPTMSTTIRSAYIDMIKQLEVVDTHLLNVLYKKYTGEVASKRIDAGDSPTVVGFERDEIIAELKVSRAVYEDAVDNLRRLRCVTPLVLKLTGIRAGNEPLTIDKGSDVICLTTLGKGFAEACMNG